tara:strand:- start:88 stop:1287 length:1200 start_codon:yes stop_codon:yes gene_type:complete
MDNKTATKNAKSATGFITRRLSNDVLVNIATHKYKSGAYTPIDLFLNPFWQWCADFLPLWLAPNMVTLIGLGFNFAACYLITTDTNGTFQGPIKPWINIACGLFLFIYQTLDCMDGKHARATNNSSPLGQLFDHGCDALSTPLMILTLCTSIQAGSTNLVICAVLAANIPFFLAQWAESKTGSLQHSVGGFFGVTETQLLFCTIHFVSAFMPYDFWTSNVGTLEFIGYSNVILQPNTIVVFGLIVPGGLVMVVSQLLTTPASVSSYLQLMGSLLPPIVAGIFLNSSNGLLLFEAHGQLIIWTIAITMCYVTSQMIVMNMGHGIIAPIQPTALLCCGSLLATQYTDQLDMVAVVGSTELYLQLVLGITILFYFTWSLGAMNEISHVLDINVLTINKPKKK